LNRGRVSCIVVVFRAPTAAIPAALVRLHVVS